MPAPFVDTFVPEVARSKQVLLVEPDADDARLIERQLAEGQTEQFEVFRVESMAQVQALAQANSLRADVVLLDLNLPDGSGVASVQRCRELIDAPIVVLTGQVPRALIGNDAFQEVDIVGITRPCTKHNYLVNNPEDLVPVLREAFYLAASGRPGFEEEIVEEPGPYCHHIDQQPGAFACADVILSVQRHG